MLTFIWSECASNVMWNWLNRFIVMWRLCISVELHIDNPYAVFRKLLSDITYIVMVSCNRGTELFIEWQNCIWYTRQIIVLKNTIIRTLYKIITSLKTWKRAINSIGLSLFMNFDWTMICTVIFYSNFRLFICFLEQYTQICKLGNSWPISETFNNTTSRAEEYCDCINVQVASKTRMHLTAISMGVICGLLL